MTRVIGQARAGRRFLQCWCVVMVGVLGLSRALAQDAPTTQPTTDQAPSTQPAETPAPAREVSVESIQAQIEKLKGATGLEEALRASLLETLEKTLAQLNAAATHSTQAAEFVRKRQTAAADLDAARKSLQREMVLSTQPATQPAEEITSLTVEQAETRQGEAEALMIQRQTEYDALEAEAKTRKDRRAAIPKRVAEINQQLADLNAQLNSPPPAGEAADLTLARNDLLSARRRALEQELLSLQEELRVYDATVETLTARRDLALLRRDAAEQRAAGWLVALQDLRQRQAAQQAQDAARASETMPGLLRTLAQESQQLAEARAKTLAAEQGLTRLKQEIKAQADALKRRHDEAAGRIKAGGLTNTVGEILRRERARLPDVPRLQRDIRAREREIADAEMRILDLEDRRRELLAPDFVERLIGQAASQGITLSDESQARLRELHRTQIDLVAALIADLTRYTRDMTEVNTTQRGVVTAAQAFREFIDENVLWIRSTVPLHQAVWPANPVRQAWLVLEGARRGLINDFGANPLPVAALALPLLLLLLAQRRLRQRLNAISEQVAGLYTDSFVLTLEALLITALIAVPWPALLAAVGWRISSAPEVSLLGEAAGRAMIRVALVWFMLALVRQGCRARGLFQAHLGARTDSLSQLRRHLTWLMPGILSLGFIGAFAELAGDELWTHTYGRAAFVLGMLALTVFTLIVLRPNGAITQNILKRYKDGWLEQLRYIWYGLLGAAPLALAVLAWLGYYYAALQFEQRIILTFGFVVGLYLVHALLLRWLYVAQRRLALEQVRKKRAAEAKALAAGENAVAETSAAAAEQQAVNVVALSTQTRHLLRTAAGAALLVGAWLIWIDILPAFGFLRSVTLWSHTIAAPAGSGAAATIVPITLADTALALLLVIVTVVLSRNIPGALEITILQRLPLEPAGRYAITTVSRYAIVIIGLIVAFSVIGIGWSEVQWLAAAITLGLGFGLNEIFANFVSGLIILFERPVRVGDIVTVGGVTGRVSQIRMRATRVIDWDRKEHVIPNRLFITSEVTNWTLSDTTVRLSIEVGVAYGSDTRLVQKLLVQAAEENPLVLKQPPPAAFFIKFGESTLDFRLLAILRDAADDFRARHDINTAIDASFRRAGIEIAFPQREVRIRREADAFREGAESSDDAAALH